MRVVVTRPARQAAAWVSRLREAGIDAIALPLIAIEGPDDPGAVAAAWHALASRRLVMFVSPNAAQSFFDHAPPGLTWPHAVQAASPGPGTTTLLRELGLSREQILEPAAEAAQFDSESLWARLRLHDWSGASVLVVRGAAGRDWLSTQLRAAGARVDHLAAYRRALPVLDAREHALLEAALTGSADHLWLLSSSEAVDALLTLGAAALQADPAGMVRATAADARDAGLRPTPVPAASPEARLASHLSAARGLATHPRIAARAQQRGFGTVHECRPTLADVVACIQSMRP